MPFGIDSHSYTHSKKTPTKPKPEIKLKYNYHHKQKDVENENEKPAVYMNTNMAFLPKLSVIPNLSRGKHSRDYVNRIIFMYTLCIAYNVH